MFKVYDSDRNFLMILDSCQDIHTTEQLSTGTKNLQFSVPVNDINLQNLIEENYIQAADYNYVIKEILLENNAFFQVFCIADYEDLKASLIQVVDIFQMSLEQAYTYCITLAGWTLNYNSQNHTACTYQMQKVNGFDLLKRIARDYDQEIWLDTKNKVLNVYDRGEMGVSLGAYYTNELKLKQLRKQSSTYEYCTLLYPYGKNGLNIAAINNGKEYITNYTYTDKVIEKVWHDNSYRYAEDLKKAAELYLEELSQPKASYKLQLSSLGESVQLGDTILLIDNIKKIKQRQRVVKIVKYPKEPERSYIEISNLRVDFTDTYLNDQKKLKKDIEYIKEVLEELQGN